MSRARITKGILFALAVVLSLLQIGLFSQKMNDQILQISSNRSDQAPWALGQLEVEYHRFLASLHDAHTHSSQLEDVRMRFDIFFSRVTLLEEGASFEQHRNNPAFATPLAAIRVFLDASAETLDSSDVNLKHSLAIIRAQTATLGEDVRELALIGIKIDAQQTDQRRATASEVIYWHSVQSALMMLLLFFLIAGLWGLERVRHLALRNASLSKARTEAIVKSATDAIFLCNELGEISEMNAAAHQMFNLQEHLPRPLHLNTLIRGKKTDGIYNNLWDSGLLNRDRMDSFAFRADGTQFPVEISLTRAETGQEGDIYVAYVRDISKKAQTERALLKAHDEAKANAKAKSDLLTVMSHETRTPLNGILGAAELLKKTGLQDKQLELVTAMETSANLLLHHVNDVLDLSRMDAGQTDLVAEPFDLAPLIQDIMHGQRARATNDDIDLITDISPDLPKVVVGDAQKLRQILLNLLGNALKFTESGMISLEVEPIGEGPIVELRVMDTGTGIETRQLSQIFEDFYTGDSTYARRREGTGLGLGIVKRMVTAMGGDVGAESVLGEGSLFWVRLPLPCENTEVEKTKTAAPRQAGLSILLVEDNEINRMITKQMLINSGHQVEVAENGEIGAAKAACEAYNLIFMDISMPGMDGMQTAAKIRTDAGPSAKVPIIALTAHSRPEDLARVKSAGIQHILTKPFTESALDAMIQKVMGDVFLSGTPQFDPPICPPLLDPDLVQGVLRNLAPEQLSVAFSDLARDISTLIKSFDNCSSAEALDLAEIHRLTGATAVLGLAKLRQHLIKAETLEMADPHDFKAWTEATQTLWEHSKQAFASEVATHADQQAS